MWKLMVASALAGARVSARAAADTASAAAEMKCFLERDMQKSPLPAECAERTGATLPTALWPYLSAGLRNSCSASRTVRPMNARSLAAAVLTLVAVALVVVEV